MGLDEYVLDLQARIVIPSISGGQASSGLPWDEWRNPLCPSECGGAPESWQQP
jgi:hypothetical protein